MPLEITQENLDAINGELEKAKTDADDGNEESAQTHLGNVTEMVARLGVPLGPSAEQGGN